MKHPIHFAHANGFPSGTYRKLFRLLEEKYDIGFLDQHGHDPDHEVLDDWAPLSEELKRTLEEKYEEPVFGVGHSLGGILHLLVAAKEPKIYRSILLLDSPIISPLSSLFIKYAKKAGLMKKYSPAAITRARRRRWPNKEDAVAYFREKEKFEAFDPEVLRDYIEFGTVETADGIRLAFDPEIEARIYETLPHDLPELRGRLRVPVDYIGGTDSREARLARLGFMKRKFAIRFEYIDGSHLYPFEKPIETARLIDSLLSRHINSGNVNLTGTGSKST